MNGAPPLGAAFRAAMRRMGATVCVVTACGEGGARRGITASSVVSLSAEPPALLVAINRKSSLHECIHEGTRICVNLLSDGQRDVADAFSSVEIRGDARFDVGRWSALAGVPALDGAQASLACTVERGIDYATHTVLFARVDAVRSAAGGSPLMYLDGRYLPPAAA